MHTVTLHTCTTPGNSHIHSFTNLHAKLSQWIVCAKMFQFWSKWINNTPALAHMMAWCQISEVRSHYLNIQWPCIRSHISAQFCKSGTVNFTHNRQNNFTVNDMIVLLLVNRTRKLLWRYIRVLWYQMNENFAVCSTAINKENIKAPYCEYPIASCQ